VKTIGKYEIVEELDKGDVGTYYRVQDLVNETSFLIQELYPKHANDDNFVRRFQRAVKASEFLQHDNILNTFEFGKSETSVFNVSDYHDGLTVSKLLARVKKIPLEVSCEIIIQSCQGLKKAHQENIIHRNLKPNFILVGRDGIVRISDFGLAYNDEKLGSIHLVPAQIGTAHYLSSELALGMKLDQRADIFSLGIIFYEMLTGVNPFAAETFAATFTKLKSEEPPEALMNLNPELPERINTIVQKMLKKNRNDRYKTCDDVLDDLASFLKSVALPSGKELLIQYMQSPESYAPTPIPAEKPPIVAPPPSTPVETPVTSEETAFFEVDVPASPPVQPVTPADESFDLDLDMTPDVPVTSPPPAEPVASTANDFLDLDTPAAPAPPVETVSSSADDDFLDLDIPAPTPAPPVADQVDGGTQPASSSTDDDFLDLDIPTAVTTPEPTPASTTDDDFLDLDTPPPASETPGTPPEPATLDDDFLDLDAPAPEITPASPPQQEEETSFFDVGAPPAAPASEPAGVETPDTAEDDAFFNTVEGPPEQVTPEEVDETAVFENPLFQTGEPVAAKQPPSDTSDDLIFTEKTDEIELTAGVTASEETSILSDVDLASEFKEPTPVEAPSARSEEPPMPPPEPLDEDLQFTDFNEDVEILEDIPELEDTKVIEPVPQTAKAEPKPKPEPKPEPPKPKAETPKPKPKPAPPKPKAETPKPKPKPAPPKPKAETPKPSEPEPKAVKPHPSSPVDEKWVKYLVWAAGLLILINAGLFFGLRNPQEAVLLVESTPDNAKVAVNGIVRASQTPAIIRALKPGEHLIELTNGDLVFQHTVTLEGGKKYRLVATLYDPSLLEEMEEPASTPTVIAEESENLRQVKILSEPSGAYIYINGEPAGTSPSTVNLPLGTVEVKLIAVGYEDYVTEIGHTETPQELKITLTPIEQPAEVVAETPTTPDQPEETTFSTTISTNPPGATVYVQGKAYDQKTPLSLELPTGDYPVRIEIEGYKPVTKNIYPGLGELTVNLEAETPRLATAPETPAPEQPVSRPPLLASASINGNMGRSGAQKIDLTKPSTQLTALPTSYRRGVKLLGSTAQLPAELTQYAELRVAIDTVTDIYINGHYQASTPLSKRIKLAPGDHIIRIVDPQGIYRDYVKKVSVNVGDQISISTSDLKHR